MMSKQSEACSRGWSRLFSGFPRPSKTRVPRPSRAMRGMLFEPLEGRALLSANVTSPLADVAVARSSPTTVIDMDPAGTVVRFDTTKGDFFVQLYNSVVPTTVNNFLGYVNGDDYASSFIHRSDQNQNFRVIQGGSFTVGPSTTTPFFAIEDVVVGNSIPLEFSIPNTRGTIAMARSTAQNSATSGFFFNNADNTGAFNAQNPYAVFGATVFGNNTAIDAIAATSTFNFGSPFGQIPLTNYTEAQYNNDDLVAISNFIVVNDVSVATGLTYSITGNTNPSLVTTTLNANNKSLLLSYTPNAVGIADITVRLTDSSGTFVEDTFRVTVVGPSTNPDTAFTRRNTPVIINTLANDTAVGTSLVAITLAKASNPQNGSVTLQQLSFTEATFTYTPNPGFIGTDTFTYTVTDAEGITSLPTTVTVHVNSPPAAVDDSASTASNTPVIVNVLANDSDFDGVLNPTSVVIVSAPANGIAAVNPTTGAITYTPNTNFAGLDTFTYTVRDNDNNTSNIATANVAVGNNIPPVAADDSAATQASIPVVISVLANDTDFGGSLVPGSVAIATQPANGSVSVNPQTGAVTYTPANGFSGNDSFTYTVLDDDGALSNAANVSIDVAPRPNTPPVVANDSARTPPNTAVVVNVLANDTDAEGTIVIGSLAINAQPAHGMVSINPTTGAVTYTPNTGFLGTDTFTYTVLDNAGSISNSATVSIATVLTTGLTGAKQVVFTDADGTLVTIKVGKADAELLFAGGGVQFTQTPSGATITGTNVTLQTISITGSTAASTLAITTKGGNNLIDVGQITATGELKSITGKGVNLTGGINAQGAVASIALASLSNATITLGAAASTKTALALSLVGGANNSTLTAVTGIKSISAIDWTRTVGASGITAPWLSKLTLKGNLFGNLTLSGVGATKDTLGPVGILGDLLGGVWRITGNAATLSAANISQTWDAEITGNSKGLTTKGNLSGSLTAATLGSLSVGGNATNATLFFITFANPQTPKVNTLGTVSIKGTADALNLRSAGNVGAVSIGALYNSVVSAGVYFDIETLPESNADLFVPAAIASLKINGIKGQEFGLVNSLISAAFLGATTINFPDLDNDETPFGVAATSIKSIAYKDANTSLKISSIQQLTNIPEGDFEVRILD